MAVIRTPFSLALSTCIWGQSLVLRINRRLPWVLITGRILQRNKQQQLTTDHNFVPWHQVGEMAPSCVHVKYYKNSNRPFIAFQPTIKTKRIFQHKQTEVMFVGLPRRDCSVPSSVDAMSLSLSNPRPLSIHDWVVFSNTYNLHCIWIRSVTIKTLLLLAVFLYCG